MQQLELDLAPIRYDYDAAATIEDRFRAFHARNPHVYEALRRLALDLKRKGQRQYGIKGLFEVLRWHYSMRIEADDFKLNNNFTALYARALMEQEPELKGFFETRERTSARRQPA